MLNIVRPKRPVLRYHGGKWMIGPWVISHFPSHRVYVEPYGGAASVLMQKPRSFAEVYNDLDDEVVNLFRVLRDPASAERLTELLRLTPWARTEFFAAYEPTEDPIEKARRIVVRSCMAFGTTGRRKNQTGFRGRPEIDNNTGAADFVNYPAAIGAVTERLRGVIIENKHALKIIRQQDGPETLLYVDPPYPERSRTSIRWPSRNDRCYAHEMTDDEHRVLAEVLHSVKGMVVLSGYRSDLYDQDLYADWASFQKDTFADGGKKRVEVVWLNAAAVQRLQEDQNQGALFS
jgi:DNA adenine methylase